MQQGRQSVLRALTLLRSIAPAVAPHFAQLEFFAQSCELHCASSSAAFGAAFDFVARLGKLRETLRPRKWVRQRGATRGLERVLASGQLLKLQVFLATSPPGREHNVAGTQ